MLSTTGARQFRVASHSPLNFVGGFQEPLGADARVISFTAHFAGAKFEGHKPFLQILDANTIPGKPALLVHPVWGKIFCYPEQYTPQINFGAMEATVNVTVRRHFVAPEVLTPIGVYVLFPYDGVTVGLSAAAYAASLAFMTAWNSQLLQAALLLIRAASSVPAFLERGATAIAEYLVSYVENLGDVYAEQIEPDPYDNTSSPPPPVGVRRALRAADRVENDYLTSAAISGADLNAIADGNTTYQAGRFADGAPARPGTAQPSPRFHAALFCVAFWRATCEGKIAAALARQLVAQMRENKLEAADAASAVNTMRGRLAATVRLVDAALGVHAAPAIRVLGAQAAQLLDVVADLQQSRPQSREIEITSRKPLALIALAAANNDPSQVDDVAAAIRKLNPQIKDDFNRLPIGTALRVPA